MDKVQILKAIFDNDPLGLLILKPKATQINAADLLLASFQKVIEFYEENNRIPQQCKDIHESQLYYALQGFWSNPSKTNYLKQYDDYGLLDDEKKNEIVAIPKEYQSIIDIFADLIGK